MTPVDIAVALIRTTLAASAAALAAWALLAWLRIDSPRIHRTAWLLVIAQGWLFFPLTIEIETTSPPPTKRAAGLVPAVIAEQGGVSFENEAEWGRGPFATSDFPLVENSLSQKVPDPFSLVLAAWLLGALALTIYAIYRYWRVLRTLPLGSPPDEPAWQAEWRSALVAAKLRRRQTVDLRVTASLGPLLHWAPWSYLILVPRELWSALASPERQAILRHELAHLRRRDLWKSLAIRVLALPQWFNPLVWFAVRRFDEAAEWACDDAAAATDAGRLTFAASLLQSAEYAVAPYPASAPAARGALTRRIHRLVSPRFKEESKMKLLVLPLLLLLLTIFQLLRIERVVAMEKPQPVDQASSLANDDPMLERIKLRAQTERMAKMQHAFNYAAKAEYVIEAPDIVTVKLRRNDHSKRAGLKQLPPSAKDLLDGRQCVVNMDGTIYLGEFGFVNVGGKTVDEAIRTVAGQFPQFADGVSLSVHSSNSKVLYVVIQDAEGDNHVTRMPMPYPLRPDGNVANAIEHQCCTVSSLLHRQDLAACQIALMRPANAAGANNKYLIEWNVAKNAPAELYNYPLLPGDQLFIVLPQLDAQAEPEATSILAAPPTSVEVKFPYRLQPHDTLKLRVARPHRPAHALTWGDIEGEFTVTHFGDVELSSGCGIVAVADLTVDEARAAIERQLRKAMPNCEVNLTLGTLAAEKYVILIQRPDGTEIAAGALRPDSLSEAEYFDFRSFVGDLVPIREVKLERKSQSSAVESINPSTVWDVVQAPQMPANEHRVRPGDRLIITVDQDWSSRRYPPVWLVPCDVAGERDYGQIRFRPGWSPLYNTQFDHPDVQRPAAPRYTR